MRAARVTRLGLVVVVMLGCGIACGGAQEPAEPVAAPTVLGVEAIAADYRIVYSRDAGDGSALYGLDLERRTSAKLTEDMPFAGYPVWSPAGDRVVFLGEGEAGSGLLSLDAATGQVDLLIEGMGEPVDFSPDGVFFVLTRDLPAGGRGLFRQRVASGTEERIDTGSDADAYARWSPAGGAIAFESGRDGNPEIHRHDLDTGMTERLTENSELDEWPSLSPDGVRIAWASGTEESKHLWVMRADGSDKRQLTDGPRVITGCYGWRAKKRRRNLRWSSQQPAPAMEAGEGDATHAQDYRCG